jgi:glycine dehydrogenase subunit 1
VPDRSAHPFVPNSAPAARAAMLARIGVAGIDDLYAAIPQELRNHEQLELPAALASEHELERHIADLLARDPDPERLLCFLGGGCAAHHVPALVEEIVGRAEFLTAYWANAYSDHGKYQAFFEFASLLGELLDLDAVSQPTYDWGMAAGVSLRMACRATGRSRVLVSGGTGPERAAVIRTYLAPDIEIVELPAAAGAGTLELAALEEAVDGDVAAAYFETPTYLGAIETATSQAVEILHAADALAVVGVDPISLGVLASPATLGADIVCGDLQSLGVPMLYGGGLSGFVATRDDERLVREYPTFLIGRTDTVVPGEHGFGLVASERTSYMRREGGKDFGGTTTALWGIAAAVYLSMLGAAGMRELGEGILQRRAYAAKRLAEIEGVSLPAPGIARFKEFPVSFAGTGSTVDDINRRLLQRGILGGHALSKHEALYCITEVHQQGDIDRLVEAVASAVRA